MHDISEEKFYAYKYDNLVCKNCVEELFSVYN